MRRQWDRATTALEQAEMLVKELSEREPDWSFVRTHAQIIIQLCDSTLFDAETERMLRDRPLPPI